jgi:hypothetical protein
MRSRPLTGVIPVTGSQKPSANQAKNYSTVTDLARFLG